jgi:hypothetical protein
MTTVTHHRFGTGTVISSDDKNVTVDFCGEIKQLIKAFANLVTEDGKPYAAPAPAYKPKKTKSQKRVEAERKFTAQELAKIERLETDKEYALLYWEAKQEDHKQAVLGYGKYE